MADLNETLVEVTPKEEKADVAQEVKEASENTIENNVVAKEETYECEKCDRIFAKQQARNLHVNKANNKKSIKIYSSSSPNKAEISLTHNSICLWSVQY